MLDACNDMNGIFKYLTYKKLEMKECILTTGTTDALVLKKTDHQYRQWYFIKISLDFVPKGPIDNNPALV